MVRTETGDGTTLAGRPELQTILDFIHPGETLVVTRIDRVRAARGLGELARRRTSASLGDAAISSLLVRVRSYVHTQLTSSRASAPIAVVWIAVVVSEA